ncbi:hypothetical protein Plhal304r1_c029g0095951 [Plasmopara halstedii]
MQLFSSFLFSPHIAKILTTSCERCNCRDKLISKVRYQSWRFSCMRSWRQCQTSTCTTYEKKCQRYRMIAKAIKFLTYPPEKQFGG